MQYWNKLSNESGGIAFYAMVTLPVMLTLLILAVDVTGWHSLREVAQREADRVALQAVQLLPNTTTAALFINNSLSAQPAFRDNFEFDFPEERSAVTLTIRSEYSSAFDHFLRLAFGESRGNRAFTVERHSRAQIAPTDYIIILNDGHTLRPSLGSDPWDSLEWPSSFFWQCSIIPPPRTVIRGGMPVSVSSDPAGWATQACFNPIWSGLKLAAIKAVDFFGAHSKNRLSVIFTPGSPSQTGFSFSRHLVSPSGTRPGGFIDSQSVEAESGWVPYSGGDSYIGDEACIALSLFDTRYALPPASSFFGIHHPAQNGECPSALRLEACSGSATFSGFLDPCYFRDNLRLREAIYWHSARLSSEDGFLAEPDISQALQQAIQEAAQSGTSEDVRVRGNLAHRNHRRILVFTDSLPDPTESALRTALHNAARQKAQIIFIVLLHDNAPSTTSERVAQFVARNGAIGEVPEEIVQTFLARDTTELHDRLLPALFLLGRRYALQT